MRSETALWIALRDHGLGAFGELTRIESPITPGLPDVHYALVCPWGNAHGQGWIELKCVARAPARAATPVRYKYRFMQPEFLHRQWELGGHAYVLGQVGQEYLLHKGDTPYAAGAGIEQPLATLRSTALYHFSQPWARRNTLDLLNIFTNRHIL